MDTHRPPERGTAPKGGAARAAGALEGILLICALVFALTFVLMSFAATSHLDLAKSESRTILTKGDPVLLNLAVTVVALALLRVLRITHIPDWFVKGASIGLLILLALVGIVWSFLVKATPASDAGVLFSGASRLAGGDLSVLQDTSSYEFFLFSGAPYRLGLLGCLEGIIRLFGERGALIVLPVLNVLLLVSGYAALLKTTQLLFGDNRITFLTLLFLCVCLQPLFACAGIDGEIPALAFSLWALYFTVRFLQNGRKRELLFLALFGALAVFLDHNAWIIAAVVSFFLLLQALTMRGWKPLLAAAILLALCVSLPKIAQAAYEDRLDVLFGEGYSYSSRLAAGWNDDFNKEMYDACGADMDAITTRSKEELAKIRLTFHEDPAKAGARYQERFAAQWNEPTFAGIWIGTRSESYAARAAFAQALGEGKAPYPALEQALDYGLQLVYVGFALSILLLLHKRSVEQVILPVAIAAGAAYHLLMGADAAGTLLFLPLLLPCAAYGILSFGVNPRPWFAVDRVVVK